MKPAVLIFNLVSALGIALGMINSPVLSAQPEPVTREVLLKTDMEGKDANMYMATIAPGAATPKHYHPGYEFAYVIEGTGVLEEDGKPPMALKPGVSFSAKSSSAKAEYAHVAKNTGKTPLKILVVLITEKGQPLAIPVK